MSLPGRSRRSATIGVQQFAELRKRRQAAVTRRPGRRPRTLPCGDRVTPIAQLPGLVDAEQFGDQQQRDPHRVFLP